MSHLGHRDRDLLIPPRPRQISTAGTIRTRSPAQRLTSPKPRLGAVQEASLAGLISLSLSWAAAELAFLIWG